MQEQVGFSTLGRQLGILAVAVWLGAAGSAVAQDNKVKLDVVYVPTPQQVVNRMLQMADLKKGETHIDLGSGDGRTVVTAAKDYGARSFGVDINPERVKEANENAKKAGVTDMVDFRIGNLYEYDISKADVLSLYLLNEINVKLRPRILSTMRPGSRVVSHAFDMDDWKPDQQDTVDGRRVFLWIVPAQVEGKWKVENGERNFVLTLDQEFQELKGSAEIDGKSVPIQNAELDGANISFTVDVGGKQQTFKGKVEGNSIAGSGEGGAGTWKATKS